jgi:hypothetical protein
MDQTHQEYIDYYRARVKKYEGNPIYPNSLASEEAILQALESCATLGEFRGKMESGDLALKNARALVRDQETCRAAAYREMKEFVKARGSEQILAELDSLKTVMDLTSRVNEIRARNSIEQSVDLLTDTFYGDFLAMENIETWRKAEVPSKWRKELDSWAEDSIREGRKIWSEEFVPRARQWDPQWRFHYELLGEERHRRKIPLPDGTVKRRIEDHRKYRGE